MHELQKLAIKWINWHRNKRNESEWHETATDRHTHTHAKRENQARESNVLLARWKKKHPSIRLNLCHLVAVNGMAEVVVRNSNSKKQTGGGGNYRVSGAKLSSEWFPLGRLVCRPSRQIEIQRWNAPFPGHGNSSGRTILPHGKGHEHRPFTFCSSAVLYAKPNGSLRRAGQPTFARYNEEEKTLCSSSVDVFLPQAGYNASGNMKR